MCRTANHAQMAATRTKTENLTMTTCKRFALLLFAGALFTGPLAEAARVTVTIDGIRSTDGVIMVGLCDAADAFPNRFIVGQSTPAKTPSVTLVFENVEPGRYAMSAFHDRNNNGKLDRGAFGVPQEPFGFSRGARGMMGPPSFDDAAFDVPAEGLSLVIHLK
jgi:uncharacterized protein (DUF2141 family)